MPTPVLLNRFVNVFNALYRTTPPDPPRSFRKILDRSRPLSETVRVHDRFIFIVEGKTVVDVCLAPTLSEHAKERFAERFQELSVDARRRQLIFDFVNGKKLTRRERQDERIADGSYAIRCEDRIYVCDPNTFTVFTFIRAN